MGLSEGLTSGTVACAAGWFDRHRTACPACADIKSQLSRANGVTGTVACPEVCACPSGIDISAADTRGRTSTVPPTGGKNNDACAATGMLSSSMLHSQPRSARPGYPLLHLWSGEGADAHAFVEGPEGRWENTGPRLVGGSQLSALHKYCYRGHTSACHVYLSVILYPMALLLLSLVLQMLRKRQKMPQTA